MPTRVPLSVSGPRTASAEQKLRKVKSVGMTTSPRLLHDNIWKVMFCVAWHCEDAEGGSMGTQSQLACLQCQLSTLDCL